MRRMLLCGFRPMWAPWPPALRRIARSPLACGLLLCAIATAARPALGADLAEARYVREVWLDDARQRHVNVRITLPPPGSPHAGPLPVLLFSTPQGFRWGGHTDHYTELAEELLRRGVAMVTLFHYDLAEPMEPHERFSDIYPGIRTGERNDASVDRFEDCRFVLEELARIDREARDGWPTLDLERIAVAGHSAGALTALHLGGMPVRDRDGRVFAVQPDSRVKALVLYSYPLEYGGPSRADLRRVGAVAGLHVAGSHDHPEYRGTAYRYVGGAPQYWLVVDGDHNVGAFGSEELVLQVTGDFVDAHLQGDADARSRLSRSALAPHEGALVEFGIRLPSYRPNPDHRDFVAWARTFLPWGEWLHARAIESSRARERPQR